jgi:hypothetical protein
MEYASGEEAMVEGVDAVGVGIRPFLKKSNDGEVMFVPIECVAEGLEGVKIDSMDR